MNNALDRREFLAVATATLAGVHGTTAAEPPRKIAALTTVFRPNAHAELIAGRLLDGYNLDGKGERPALQLVSLYTDQRGPDDLSAAQARKHGFRLASSVTDALTLGGKDLAVDGVLLIAEQGTYPRDERGATLYPRRRFFEETVQIFRRSKRVVPVFSDKHLAATWEDAKWVYDASRELGIPFMAGSSVPVVWRKPALDVPRGAPLTEIVALSYSTPDSYGIHALEMVQCLAERRKGGETGVAAVRFVEGPEVWKLGEQGGYDRRLLDAAVVRWGPNAVKGKLEDIEKDPLLFQVEYKDGLKASVFTQGKVGEWTVAWREHGKEHIPSTLFWCQHNRPYGHFGLQLKGIERMFLTGKPTWPVERTLLTTGVLDAVMTSRAKKNIRIETPHLAIAYQPTYTWKEPPLP